MPCLSIFSPSKCAQWESLAHKTKKVLSISMGAVHIVSIQSSRAKENDDDKQ